VKTSAICFNGPLDAGATTLSSSLKVNTSLENLHLMNNMISSISATAIADIATPLECQLERHQFVFNNPG
jgi:hypothetical protein